MICRQASDTVKLTFHGTLFLTAQLCYYNSSKDGKCHGTIMIRDIEKVEEAEPQTVPTLKENEAGFFFAVSHQVLRKSYSR